MLIIQDGAVNFTSTVIGFSSAPKLRFKHHFNYEIQNVIFKSQLFSFLFFYIKLPG